MQKNYSEGGGERGRGWLQFSLFISFLPIRRQNVPLLSEGAEVVGVEAAEGRGHKQRRGVRAGRRRWRCWVGGGRAGGGIRGGGNGGIHTSHYDG